MGKNFATLYAGGNDSSALNQSFFLKVESLRGSAAIPVGTDFFFTMSGGSINYSQPYENSPHRSGRHNNNIVKQKTSTEWSLSTLFNLATGGGYASSIDTAVKALFKSLLGRESDNGSALVYDAKNDPAITFTLIENLDVMAKQAVGCFVESCEIQLPGDGMAQASWSGRGKTVLHAGIAKSETENAGNVITVGVGEARRFDVGALVMIVKADGLTRSTDTATSRKVVAVDLVADTVTLDGAALTDADGTTTPVYLCYYEPSTVAAIDNPQTGLKGSLAIDTLPGISCMRSATISLTNNHEVVDYCYGTDGLSGALFVPGGRLDVKATIELNLNAQLVGFMKRIRSFEAHEIALVLGDEAAHHLKVEMPKVIFNVPSISVPETGSVPVSFEGTALQSEPEAADEIAVKFL